MTAYIDRIDTLGCVERNGVIRELTRKCRVTGLTSTNYSILLDALDEAGVPAYGATLSGSRFSSLSLTDRNPEVVELDRVVDVTLRYSHFLEGPNQDLHNPKNGILFGKGRSSITNKPTNFYRPYGVGLPTQIVVAHTFPLDDPDLPGKTKIQIGEVDVAWPQSNFQLEGFLELTDLNPWAVVNSFIRTVNAFIWMSQPPYTWICSDVQFECMDYITNKYRFQFEFQNDPDGWFPSAVFNDERTSHPPAGLRPATELSSTFGVLDSTRNPFTNALQPAGAWTVPALTPVNYDALFMAYFEGTQAGFFRQLT